MDLAIFIVNCPIFFHFANPQWWLYISLENSLGIFLWLCKYVHDVIATLSISGFPIQRLIDISVNKKWRAYGTSDLSISYELCEIRNRFLTKLASFAPYWLLIDWLREITWLLVRGRFCGKRPNLQDRLLIGLDRSHDFWRVERGRKNNKFLTFDSISTSDDESDVLKTNKNIFA